jgi:hypothetical protein
MSTAIASRCKLIVGSYAFVNRWPHSIQEDFPEDCSFRQQKKMRKKLNHLSVRLGLGIPDVKRFVHPVPQTPLHSIGECAARRSARPCAPEARLAAEPVCPCPSGRDLVEVCRRLPADVAYLLNRCHPRTRVPISGRL